MTVYVDIISTYPLTSIKDPQARRHGTNWSHMWADELEELHILAAKIGMKKSWFQDRPGFPHYDLVPTKRRLALNLGAQHQSLKDFRKARGL